MVTQLPSVPVVVVGGGFSGLATGAKLKHQLGLDDYVIYERSPDFGGTWWANVYPGCGVDIPSLYYSLSFAPNPYFSKFFPEQPEILQYIKDTARKFDVDTHVKVNHSWDRGVWQEEKKTWKISVTNVVTGEQFEQECNVLISCIGGLVNPNPCLIPGVDSFKGDIAHTARWRKEIVLDNKNVVILGNGCSGTQVVPAIADQAKNIYHFFRSSQFYFPRRNPKIPSWLQFAFAYIPFFMVSMRWLLFNFLEYTFGQFYTDSRGDRQRRRAKKMSDDYVEKAAPPKYWDMLKPKYQVGCKRRVFDPGYLQCLHRDNVHLTNDPVVKIEEHEVLTDSGKRYPADVIILANGFETTRFGLPLFGRGGVTPEQHWQKFGGIEAYKSVALSAFPNFFTVFGPNAATGHTSALFSIETHIDLVLKVAKPIIKKRQGEVSVKFDYEKEYSDKQQKDLSNRVWADCQSYYKDAKGWNFAIFPHSSYWMWWQARFPDMKAWSYSKLKYD